MLACLYSVALSLQDFAVAENIINPLPPFISGTGEGQ